MRSIIELSPRVMQDVDFPGLANTASLQTPIHTRRCATCMRFLSGFHDLERLAELAQLKVVFIDDVFSLNPTYWCGMDWMLRQACRTLTVPFGGVRVRVVLDRPKGVLLNRVGLDHCIWGPSANDQSSRWLPIRARNQRPWCPPAAY